MGRRKSAGGAPNPAIPSMQAAPVKPAPRRSARWNTTKSSRSWMSSRSSAAAVVLAASLLAQAPLAQSPVATSSQASLQHDVDAIVAAPAFDRAFWGVLVRPVGRDETLYAMNAGKLMTPASTMK